MCATFMRIGAFQSFYSPSALAKTQAAIGRSLERLSAGKRVLTPRDDSAAYTMGVKLDSQIRGLSSSSLNINQAKGLLETADNAISTQMEILRAMRDIGLQAQNSTLTQMERSDMQGQLQTLMSEFHRITNETEFGGKKLLNGNFGSQTVSISDGGQGSVALNLPNFSGSNAFLKDVGLGRFNTQRTYAAGDAPGDVVSGDVNGDGVIDAVVANTGTGDNIGIHLGRGDGVLYSQRTISVGASPGQLKLADVTGDGHLDIIHSEALSTQIAIHVGNGDGTFQTRTTLSVGASGSGRIQLGDYDNDGDLDLFHSGNTTNGVYYRTNNGDGTFTTANTIAVPLVGDFRLGDVNKDGFVDVVVSDISNAEIETHLGNGTSFSLYSSNNTSALGSETIDLITALADLDRDGDLDVIGYHTGSSATQGFSNNGLGAFTFTGTWSGLQDTGVSTYLDFDQDGNIDRIIANGSTITYYRGFTGLNFLNSFDGAFVATATISLSGAAGGVGTGDFNADGTLDILLSDTGNDLISVSQQKTRKGAALGNIAVNSSAEAQNLVAILDDTLSLLQTERDSIAAVHSRLEYAASANLLLSDSLSEAKSRAVDLDIATEVAEYTRLQILQGAQVAIAAHSNLSAQIILGLVNAGGFGT